MRYCLLAFLMVTATSTWAQFGAQADQRQIDQATLLQMQHDLMIARMQAETERMRRANENMQQEAEQGRKAQELEDRIERRAAEEANASKKAEDAAEELRDEINMSSVRTANLTYLSVALIAAIGFGTYIAHRKTQDGVMKYEQKFGVVVMLCGILLALFSIAISNDWHARLDALQNILLTLRMQFFKDSEASSYASSYMIDIPTKYVLIFFTAMVAYGFTTYLGITPAWKKAAATPVHDMPNQTKI